MKEIRLKRPYIISFYDSLVNEKLQGEQQLRKAGLTTKGQHRGSFFGGANRTLLYLDLWWWLHDPN